jgi:hypothetical protein
MTKKKKSVWLKVGCPPPLKSRLTEYAKVTGLAEAEILRTALIQLFERQDWRKKVDTYYEHSKPVAMRHSDMMRRNND